MSDRLPGVRLPRSESLLRLEKLLFGLGEFLLWAFALLFLLKRIQHGIEFTDEAWYIADPYLVAKGLIPYVNDWSVSPGVTLPLALVFRVYTAVAGTEGIFLFSRYLYLVWAFAVGLLTVVLIRREIDSRFPFIAWLPISQMFFLFDINYNTIGTVYLPLILALIWAGRNRSGGKSIGRPLPQNPERDTRAAFRYALAAGILGARAIIGCPFLIVPGALVLLLLIVTKKRLLLRAVLLGLAVSAVLVIGWCCLRGSAERLLYGLYVTLKDYDYFHQAREVSYRQTVSSILSYSMPAFRFAGIALVLRLVLRRREKLLRAALILLSVGFMLAGLFPPRWTSLYGWLIFHCFFEWGILLLIPGEGKKHLGLCAAALLYYCMYVTSSLGNIWGTTGREYWLIVPSVLSFYALWLVIPHRIAARTVFSLLLAGFFVLQCRHTWNFVHRDAPIAEHTATVPSGIWKGIRTTDARAKLVVELENSIRQITEPEDKVMFRDWVSYAYVMSDGQFFSTSPLKSCSSAFNDATLLYDLFYVEQTVPDKIIFLSVEGSEISIEDETIVFNAFIEAYYDRAPGLEGEQFRILEFDLRDGEGALAWASEHASRLPWQKQEK